MRASCRSSRSPTRCASACTARRWSAFASTATCASSRPSSRPVNEIDYVVVCSGTLRPARRAHCARRRTSSRSHQLADPVDTGHPLDRDVRIPAARKADLHVGNVTEPDDDRPPFDSARKHFWMHFTRHLRRQRHPGHHARRRSVGLRPTRQEVISTGFRVVRVASRTRPGRARRRHGEASQTDRVLPGVELRARARGRARRTPLRPRARRSRPRVLHNGRQRSRRVGVEARPPILPARPANRTATRC